MMERSQLFDRWGDIFTTDYSVVTRQCPTCNAELQLPRALSEEELKYRCKNCDPSSPKDKYEWYEDYNQWGHLYTIIQCPTCNRELQVPPYKDDRVAYLCKHCDPSSPKDKYKWIEEEQEWHYYSYVITCPTCNRGINSYKYREELSGQICEYCDPSSLNNKYEWNTDKNIWELLYTLEPCPSCNKVLKVWENKSDEIDFSRDIVIHGYTCLVVPTKKTEPIDVRKLIRHSAKSIDIVYKEL